MWLEKDKDLERKIMAELGVTQFERCLKGIANSVYRVTLNNNSNNVNSKLILKIFEPKKRTWLS